ITEGKTSRGRAGLDRSCPCPERHRDSGRNPAPGRRLRLTRLRRGLLASARPRLFYRNLHRERLVRPARKPAVNIDFVRFGFCFEGVAIPIVDKAFDSEGDVAL